MKKIQRFAVLLLVLTLASVLSLHPVRAAEGDSVSQEAVNGNFRNVQTEKIGNNNLYRSQHPANGSKRSYYANDLAELKNIQTVLNLSDTEGELKKYFREADLDSSYFYRTLYDRGSVYTANLNEEHNSSSYQKRLAGALKFMARNKGPYLIHCRVGRDRTGFAILLLECLMGASYDYMLEDYSRSYVNVNGQKPEKARKTAADCLEKEFRYMSGLKKGTTWTKANLASYATRYLLKGGMTEAEIATLKKQLAVSYPEHGLGSKLVCEPGE